MSEIVVRPGPGGLMHEGRLRTKRAHSVQKSLSLLAQALGKRRWTRKNRGGFSERMLIDYATEVISQSLLNSSKRERMETGKCGELHHTRLFFCNFNLRGT